MHRRHREVSTPGFSLRCCNRSVAGLRFQNQKRRWRAAARRLPTGRERMSSPAIQTLRDPILLRPWACFPNPKEGRARLRHHGQPQRPRQQRRCGGSGGGGRWCALASGQNDALVDNGQQPHRTRRCTLAPTAQRGSRENLSDRTDRSAAGPPHAWERVYYSPRACSWPCYKAVRERG